MGGNGAIPGGGGGGSYAQAYAAGNGGNGLVIISYPTAQASQYTCNGSTTISGTNTNCTYTSNGTFVIGTTTANTTNAALQDLNYTYDADGNILTRTDKSYSGGGQQVTYAYDNLNRLLTASTTLSNIYSYTQAFTYDALGNILTGPNGSYSYQGTGNANPDAVTKTALTVGASSPTIAYDNSAIAGNGTPASSLTFSYATNSNTNGLMIVSVDESATSSCTSDKVTGVTYNGRSLTDAGYYVRNSTTVNGAVKTYYGYSPATSTNNIVVSASASCILYATAATYTGVKQSGFPDASGTGNPLSDSGAVTLFQATTTTANNNAWAVLLGVPSTSGTATAGANTTLRQQQSGNLYYADSNGPVSPAGAIGLSWSMPSATNWAANYFALTPYISNPGTTTTTLYTYDNDGNLTGVGSSTTYTYDFDNRLTQSVINGVTTSYAYDPFGSRIMQATASSTTWYPNKFVSITNATSSTSATSTDYLYAGSTLFATIDQPLVSGAATGTPVTRYIHTDNLGSTNITSDSNQNRAQWFDYAPYGSVIASTNTGTTTDARQYIGQFSDASGLSYLNARYYNPTQSQFLTEDPVFWGQQNLGDPQSFNTYSYAEGNPITGSDPSGLYSLMQVAQGQATWGQYWGDVNQGAMIMGQNPGWNFAMNHPYTTGALTALGTYPAVVAGGEISAAYGMATFPGVSASFSAQQGFAGLVYSALAVDTTLGVPGFVNTLRGFSPRKPSSYFSAVTALTFGPVSAGVGGYPGAFSDAYQFAGLLNNTLGSAAINLFSNSVQTRSSAANSFNSSLGASGKVSAGGASVPNSNSVWMTPTGAAVTFGGKLVSPPPSGK